MTEAQGGPRLGWRETLAAISVVLSLGFVGIQIRQNTQAVRGATLQAVSDSHINFMVSTFLDGVPADAAPKIFQGLGRDAFSAEENAKLNAMYLILLAHLENTYVQRSAGFVGDEVLESYGWRNSLLRSNHFRESVDGPLLGAAVSADFQQYFKERMGWQ